MIKRRIEENGLVADLFHDGSGQPRKAIVLLGGSEGGKFWSSFPVRKPMNYLVGLGYNLLSLAYFKITGLPPTLEEIPLEYFEKAFAWFATQPEVVSDEIALIGASKGAEVALLLGSMNPKIRAVVALSPSSVVWEGVPKKGVDVRYNRKSSWSYQGKELPYVANTLSSWNIGTMLGTVLFGTLRKQGEQALQNKIEVEKASIPVEKIQGALLLMSGKRDKMWPATQMCEQMMSRLAARGFIYSYEHIAYDVGHQGYIQKKDCWRAIAGFLKDHYALATIDVHNYAGN
jgi:uncharacterized protein